MSDKDGIQKLATQHYKVVVELPPDPSTGKRRRKSKHVYGPLKTAQDTRQDLLGQLKAGQLVGKDVQRVKTFLESWLAAKRGTISDRSWQRYDSLMRTIIRDLGNVRLRDLNRQMLRDYFANSRDEVSPRFPEIRDKDGSVTQAAKPISSTTIHHRFVVFKMALGQAVDDGILGKNPLEWKRDDVPKRVRTIPEIIGEEQATELVRAAVGSPIEVLVSLAYHTGARLGELLALRWRDVDFDKRTIHIMRTVVEPMKGSGDERWFAFKTPKNKKGRTISVGDYTIARLRKHRAEIKAHRLALPPDVGWTELDLVFPNMWNLKSVQPGEPMRPSTASRAFRKIADDAGHTDVRFHDLRHAHASVLISRGESLKVVSRRLGHSDEAITLRVYTHVLPGEEEAMVDRFETGFERAMGGNAT